MRKKLLSFMILFFGLLFSFSGVFALNSETDLYEKIYYHESDIVFRVYEKEDGLYYQSQKEIIFENKDQIEGYYKIEVAIYFLLKIKGYLLLLLLLMEKHIILMNMGLWKKNIKIMFLKVIVR